MPVVLVVAVVLLFGCSGAATPAVAPPPAPLPPTPVTAPTPPPAPQAKVPCAAVALENPIVAAYKLEVCQLPENAQQEYPTEFRLSKDGSTWISHVSLSPATGGYDDAANTSVEFAGERFLAITYGCDSVGTTCIMIFDLDNKSTDFVDCPNNTCGEVKSLKETGKCPIVVECSQCIFESDAAIKPSLRKEQLCEP